MVSDVELMRRVAAGDQAAFDELLTRHQSAVLNTIYRFIGNKTQAEDLAQEVFIRVYSAAGSYQPTAAFTTWLYTITRNICFNAIRDAKKGSISIDAEIEDESLSATLPDKEDSPNPLIHQELKDAVRAAVQSLPPAQRMAVILCRFEGLSYEDIAQTMGCSVPAVKSLLHRARGALKTKLESYVVDKP